MLIKEIKGRGRWAACRDSPTSSIPAVWVSAWWGSVDFGVALHAAVIQCFCGALVRNERGEGLNLGLQGEVLVMLRSCLGGVFRAFAQSSQCTPALVHRLAAGTALGTGEHTQSWLQGCSLVPVSPPSSSRGNRSGSCRHPTAVPGMQQSWGAVPQPPQSDISRTRYSQQQSPVLPGLRRRRKKAGSPLVQSVTHLLSWSR